MSNISALNRIIKLQRILWPKNSHNALLAYSETMSVCASMFAQHHSQRNLAKQQQSSAVITNSSLDQWYIQWQRRYYHKQIRCINRHITTNSSNPSSNKTPSDETVDEFRARQEKIEEEFDLKQKQNETKSENEAEQKARRAKVDAVRTKILETALNHVPAQGWTRNAIIQGAEESGYPGVVHGMFPEGGFALVAYFNGKCNEKLISQLKKDTNNGQNPIDNPLDFLVSAVRTRLEMIVPYKKQWPQALSLMANPDNAKTALAQVLTLVDDICYYSGDRSVDFNWYTRRIGLATIMKMTELFMLQDDSPQHEQTWEFLKNRMDEAVQIQSMLGQSGDITKNFTRSFNSAFLTARNILGLDYNRR